MVPKEMLPTRRLYENKDTIKYIFKNEKHKLLEYNFYTLEVNRLKGGWVFPLVKK